MGFPDTACITFRLSRSVYRPLFELVWGRGSFDISFPADTEQICATPGGAAAFHGDTTSVNLSPADRTRSNDVYDHWAQSLNAYEGSTQVTAFSSKFDAFLAGNYTMTPIERQGYNLFRGKANCNSCHLDGRGTALTPGQSDNSKAAQVNPLFTCFGSANEGLPPESQERFLLSDYAGSLRVHPQSSGLRLQRFGTWDFPEKRFRYLGQPEHNLETICTT